MTEQNQNPASTDDVEGHGRYWPSSEADQIDGEGAGQPDDTEGHSFRGAKAAADTEDAEDDTEGHGYRH